MKNEKLLHMFIISFEQFFVSNNYHSRDTKSHQWLLVTCGARQRQLSPKNRHAMVVAASRAKTTMAAQWVKKIRTTKKIHAMARQLVAKRQMETKQMEGARGAKRATQMVEAKQREETRATTGVQGTMGAQGTTGVQRMEGVQGTTGVQRMEGVQRMAK